MPVPPPVQAQLDAQQERQQSEAEAFAEQEAEKNSVGAPGFWEGLLPVWGSGRSAIHNFQTGHWGWGLLDAAFLVLDVVAVVAGVVSFGLATAAWMGVETGLKAAARAAMRVAAEGALKKAAAAKALAAAVAEGVGQMYGKAAGALSGAARRQAAAKLSQEAAEALAKTAEANKALAARLAKEAAEAEVDRIAQAICDPHALGHIFEGEIKTVRGGRVNAGGARVPVGGQYGTGVHSMEAVNSGKARIVQRGRTAANGAFEAEVELLDQAGNVIPKKAPGKSTFFPPNWSKEKTMQEIERAYNSKTAVPGRSNAWEGVASDGSTIQMFLDANGKIVSAFPTF